MGREMYLSHGNSQQRGVAILFNKNIDIKVLDVCRDEDGRTIFVKTLFNGESFIFGCIYAPNHDDPEFFVQVFNEVEQHNVDRKIIGGDFNLILDHGINRVGKGQHKNVNASKIVGEIVDEFDYIDSWRHCYPEKPGFTWQHVRPYKLLERLDLLLVNEEQFVQCMRLAPSYKSDHFMVILHLSFTISARGPSYWKLNTDLLKDRKYLESISKLIEIELAQPYESKITQWEIMKLEIRTSSLQFAKDRSNKLKVLEKKLKYLKSHQENYGIFQDD